MDHTLSLAFLHELDKVINTGKIGADFVVSQDYEVLRPEKVRMVDRNDLLREYGNDWITPPLKETATANKRASTGPQLTCSGGGFCRAQTLMFASRQEFDKWVETWE